MNQIDRQIQQGQKFDALRMLVRSLYSVAPNGELTPDAARLHNDLEAAARRARQISNYLKWDLNGDVTISQDEREAIQGRDAAEIEIFFVTADANSDGQIDIDEMLALAHSETAQSTSRRSTTTAMLAMDVDQDGRVTTQDISAALDIIEANPLNLDRWVEPAALRAAQCAAPAVPDNAQLIVLSAYEGSALSTVTVTGMDYVTHAGILNIEEGTTPLYVFVGSHSNVIWQLSGETDRVAALVVQNGREGDTGGAGVTGITRDRVHFVDSTTCLDTYVRLEGAEGAQAYQQAEQSLGRAPDTMLSFYTVASVSLPSGTETTEQGDGVDILSFNGRRYEMGPDGPRLLENPEDQLPNDYPDGALSTYRSLLRFNDDGVRTIDPDTVIASAPVQTYDVLPQQAGLLQLILEGKIQYTRGGKYLIAEPIARFPAGLSGAHGVGFLLGEGVPMPEGNPGHSSVRSVQTGECLTRVCNP